MSISTLIDSDDDFERWEAEVEESRTYRPSKAAERRAGKEQADRQQGIVRHRSHEREV